MEKCIVHFLPAMAGDCILIELEHPDCILIDCGYKTTYNTELRPLLLRLSAEGYRISLMIISHIDRDHIEGAVHFLRENGDAEIPAIIPVDEIWINGFFNTLFPRLEFKHREIDELSLEERKMLSDKLKSLKMSFPDEGYISATQCKALERLCVQNGYRVNCSCPDRIVKRSAMRYSEVATNRISIAGCQIAILNPGEPQLEALSRELDREMIRWFGRDYKIQQSDEFTQLFELLMELYEEPTSSEPIMAMSANLKSWLGTSLLAPMNAVNRSSIVVEIIYHGRNMLFTGDGESSDWVEFLAPIYDLIKISHHGSTKPNIKLLENCKAKHLLASTNGGAYDRYPENELLARMIFSGAERLHFNYDIGQKQQLMDLQDSYGFSANFGKQTIIL